MERLDKMAVRSKKNKSVLLDCLAEHSGKKQCRRMNSSTGRPADNTLILSGWSSVQEYASDKFSRNLPIVFLVLFKAQIAVLPNCLLSGHSSQLSRPSTFHHTARKLRLFLHGISIIDLHVTFLIIIYQYYFTLLTDKKTQPSNRYNYFHARYKVWSSAQFHFHKKRPEEKVCQSEYTEQVLYYAWSNRPWKRVTLESGHVCAPWSTLLHVGYIYTD